MMAMSATRTKVASAGRRESATAGRASYIRGRDVLPKVEGRRVAAERVEQHQCRGDGEEPDLARPGETTDEAESYDRGEGECAGIDEAHVLREIEPRPSPGRVPDRALRRPVFD